MLGARVMSRFRKGLRKGEEGIDDKVLRGRVPTILSPALCCDAEVCLGTVERRA